MDQRQLLAQDLQRRRNDPGFVARVKARLEADAAILDRLADYDAGRLTLGGLEPDVGDGAGRQAVASA